MNNIFCNMRAIHDKEIESLSYRQFALRLLESAVTTAIMEDVSKHSDFILKGVKFLIDYDESPNKQ